MKCKNSVCKSDMNHLIIGFDHLKKKHHLKKHLTLLKNKEVWERRNTVITVFFLERVDHSLPFYYLTLPGFLYLQVEMSPFFSTLPFELIGFLTRLNFFTFWTTVMMCSGNSLSRNWDTHSVHMIRLSASVVHLIFNDDIPSEVGGSDSTS